MAEPEDGDPSSPPPPPERPEIVAPSAARGPSVKRLAALALCLLGGPIAAIAAPHFALSVALPWLSIVAVFAVLTLEWRPASSMRIGARGLRYEQPGCASFLPWSTVRRIVDHQSSLLVELDHGATTSIDLASQPDVRAILAHAPASVVYERAPAPAPPPAGMKQSHKTILLWLLLVVMMIAIWRLVTPP